MLQIEWIEIQQLLCNTQVLETCARNKLEVDFKEGKDRNI